MKAAAYLNSLASCGFETQKLCVAFLNAVQVLLILNFELIKVHNMQYFTHVFLLMQLLLHLLYLDLSPQQPIIDEFGTVMRPHCLSAAKLEHAADLMLLGNLTKYNN